MLTCSRGTFFCPGEIQVQIFQPDLEGLFSAQQKYKYRYVNLFQRDFFLPSRNLGTDMLTCSRGTFVCQQKSRYSYVNLFQRDFFLPSRNLGTDMLTCSRGTFFCPVEIQVQIFQPVLEGLFSAQQKSRYRYVNLFQRDLFLPSRNLGTDMLTCSSRYNVPTLFQNL